MTKATTSDAAYVKIWDCIFNCSVRDLRPPPSNVGQRIETAFGLIAPREVNILRYRFGLADGFEHTYEETAAVTANVKDPTVFITRERVRQIELKTFRRLRYPPRIRLYAPREITEDAD